MHLQVRIRTYAKAMIVTSMTTVRFFPSWSPVSVPASLWVVSPIFDATRTLTFARTHASQKHRWGSIQSMGTTTAMVPPPSRSRGRLSNVDFWFDVTRSRLARLHASQKRRLGINHSLGTTNAMVSDPPFPSTRAGASPKQPNTYALGN
jgi:hypothetical protein